MENSAHQFLRQWMTDNVAPQAETVDMDRLAETLAMECLVEGELQGFSLQQLELDLGTDLATHIWLSLTAPIPSEDS